MPAEKKHHYSFVKIFIVILSLIGVGIMSYLTYIHYTNTRSFCDLSETVSCDVVTTSIYSEIFGVPISIMGLGYFLTVLLIILLSKSKKVFQLIFFLTILMLIPSLYFSILEIFVIKAVCILCEASKTLMILILLSSFFAARKITPVTFRILAPLIITGVVMSFVIYFMQTGSVVKKDYSSFVACLNKNGVVYYKSVKCNNCKRQEKLLGEAYKKLNSVECHPEGPNPKPELCLEKKISKTPTFIIEKNGVEGKRVEGLQPLEKLGAFGGCPLEEKK
ncbi:hypothetical protein HYW46_02170 [Candidatus Daviesbacteria bacterium]|nr:hypothetical protein [Candidatus Daviesbacteria bacterium]